MTDTFITPFGNFTLHCNRHDPSAQAWNQADSYLLQILSSQSEYLDNGIATINDQFGALSVPIAGMNPVIHNDSAIFRHWLSVNWPAGMEIPTVLPIDLLDSAKQKTFLLHLPKNLHFFQHELSLLSQLEDITVIVAGMQKHWPQSFYQTAHDYFSSIHVLPGVRKAKCMIINGGKKNPFPEAVRTLDFPEYGIKVINYPNLFSRDGLDIGTRFFLDHFPDLSGSQYVIDLACGNGILGIRALQLYRQLRVGFIDESHYATRSCLDSLKANNIPSGHVEVIQNDGFHGLKLPLADAILCNPPFHQQHRITDNLARTMIEQSHRQLKIKGKLFLIGNRHLQYDIVLKKRFSIVSKLAANEKFILYQAIK